MKLCLLALVTMVCIGCPTSDTNSIAVQALLTEYSVGDMHSQMETGPDEWHDGATFMIEKPEKWKDTPLTVFFPSEVKGPVLRPEVGTRYTFTIKEEYLGIGSSNHVFDGALQNMKEITRKSKPKQSSGDLVFMGTVEKLAPSPLPQSTRKWVVQCRVDKIMLGEFSGKTFSFRIHSPAKSGLEIGKQYKIVARRTPEGFAVDQYQWMK